MLLYFENPIAISKRLVKIAGHLAMYVYSFIGNIFNKYGKYYIYKRKGTLYTIRENIILSVNFLDYVLHFPVCGH